MKVVVLAAVITALFASCAHNVWLSDATVNANAKTPTELMRRLGSPAKVIDNQRLPLHKGKAQEYRYFVVTQSGQVEFRQYFFDGPKWITMTFPVPESEKGDRFKVISPTSMRFRERLERLWKVRPDLRP